MAPRWLKAAVAALLLFAHVYVVDSAPRFFNPNQVSRVHLTLAILDGGTLSIDRYLDLVGTEDRSVYRGHYYSDKAPGVSVWLVPFAWMMVGSGSHAKMTVTEYRALMYGLRVLGISIPAVVFWLACVRWFRAWAGSELRAVAVVLAGALGTNALVYSTHIFGVMPCAIALFGSFLAARSSRAADATRDRSRIAHALLAGTLAGLAFVLDPLAGFAMGVLGVYAATGRPGRTLRAAVFGVGLAGPLALWMAYNVACFGHPLETGIHHHAERAFAERYASGFHGFHLPTVEGWSGLWLSGRRGMLFLSPFLAAAVPGWVRMWRSTTARADAAVCIAVTLAVTLFATMSIDWAGGWAVGSRYLVPTLPFLLVGVAAAIAPAPDDPWVAPVLGLAASGIVAVALSEVTFPAFPAVFDNPVAHFAWPLLRSGCVASAFRLSDASLPAKVCVATHVVLAVGLLSFVMCRGSARKAPRLLLALVFALHGGLLFCLVPEPPETALERAENMARIRRMMDCGD